MNSSPSDVDTSRRDEMTGLAVISGLPMIVGLSLLAAAGSDLAHASPLLLGIGAVFIGAGLVVFDTLVKAASSQVRRNRKS